MQSQARRLCRSAAAVVLVCGMPLCGQAPADMRAILERLERLERQNAELLREVRALQAELGQRPAAAPALEAPTEERLEVLERRSEEQAQAKVESAQKLPVRLNGMVLFNAFLNRGFSGGAEFPTTAALSPGAGGGGATLRQSLIGLEFDGGQTVAGGRVSGSLQMDFYAGSSSTLNHVFRIRTAAARIDWKRTTLMAGQDKPIFSPRDPTSLAQVGVSPLTAAGNPWLWLPQVKVEQRFSFGEETGLRAQLGVLQTNEFGATVPAEYASGLARSRPAIEGRFEFKHRGLELAPGFHRSTTHVAGASLPSYAVSLDWFFSPWSKLQFTGLAFSGENIANLGTLRQGFTIVDSERLLPVHSRGGWAQVAYLPTARLSFNVMAGQHDDNDDDLPFGGFGRNQAYAGNVMYRLAPNLLVAFETSQVRTRYVRGPLRLNTHYDLALAYLF